MGKLIKANGCGMRVAEQYTFILLLAADYALNVFLRYADVGNTITETLKKTFAMSKLFPGNVSF